MHNILAIWFYLVFLFFKAVVSTNIRAELYDYETTETNKSRVLLLNKPFKLQGRVHCPDYPDGSKNYLKIEIKMLNKEFQMFDTLFLDNCTGNGSFNCLQRQEKNEYDIYLNTTVVSNFNQSEWMLTGLYNGKKFVSNKVKLPIIVDILDEVSVTLLEYNYTNTKCTKDLLITEPLCLEGKISFMDESIDIYTLDIEWGQNNSFKMFDTLAFNNCYASESFYCVKEDNSNAFQIFIKTSARALFSQSEWRLKGKYKGRDFNSTFVKVPKIFNISDVELTLNGQVLTKTNTSFDINAEELILCCTKGPSPCVAVITTNSMTQNKAAGCVKYIPNETNKTEEPKYKFGFLVCDNSSYAQKYSLNIAMKSKESKEASIGIYFWVIIALLASLFIICLVGWYCKCHKQSYESIKQNVAKSSNYKVNKTQTTQYMSTESTQKKETIIIFESAKDK